MRRWLLYPGLFAVAALGMAGPHPVCAQTSIGNAVAAQEASSLKEVTRRISELQRRLFSEGDADKTVIAELALLSDAGHPRAAFLMGEVYRLGLDAPPDAGRAIAYYERALEGGFTRAAERLAVIYKDSDAPHYDATKSVEYYRISANEGSRSARLALADALAAGLGTAVDPVQAEALYAGLMAEGDARAAVRLGTLRLSLDNASGAAEAWVFAAESGRVEVLMRLGQLLRDRLNAGPEARRYFVLAAAANVDGAAEALMSGDLEGAFGASSDTGRASHWLETDADLRTTIATARKFRDDGAVPVPALSVLRALLRHQSTGEKSAADMLVQLYARNVIGAEPAAAALLQDAMSAVSMNTAIPPVDLRRLATSAQRRKHYDIATQALMTAAEAGDSAARTQLALWHLRGQMGAVSDFDKGLALLQAAQTDLDSDSGLLIAAAFTDPTVRGATDVPLLLSVLDSAAKDGNGSAAALYLRTLRLARVADSARLSEAFMRGLAPDATTDDATMEYLILRGSNARSERAWREVASRSIALPDSQFARLLSALRGENANVLIYALQSKLESEGYRIPVNGYLTPATVRAILTFCQDHGILSSCKQGPIRSSSISAISGIFAARTQRRTP